MESLVKDPEFASEIIKLYGKELKAAEERIAELEQLRREPSSPTDYMDGLQCAAAAEATNALLQAEIIELKAANAQLVAERALEDVNPDIQALDSNIEKALQLSTELRAKEQEQQQNHATITELRDELEVLRGKYNKCNDAVRDLQAAYDELELRLEDAVPQGNTEDDIDDVCTPSSENHLSMNTSPMQRKIYMANFPAVSMRPERQELKICWSLTKCGLGLKIPPDIKSKWSLDRVFFFHEGAMWSGQHALVYGPIHRLVQIKSAGGAKWKGEEAPEFPKLYGETREMFYKQKGQIYYAGTYRGLQLPDLGSNQFMELGANARSHIIERTVLKTGRLGYKRIAGMYQQGNIGVECLGLQCVGFNHGLYDVLVQARSKSAGSNMSNLADAQMEESRKRKRDTHSENMRSPKRTRTHGSERGLLDLKEEARFEDKDEVSEEEECEEEVSRDGASEDSECAASESEDSEKEYGD